MKRKMTQIAMVSILALVLTGAGCLSKTDGTKTTPLEAAKIVQKAASDSWTSVQRTFANARLAAEKSEKAGKPLAAGQITLEQSDKFSAIDKKVRASGIELAGVTRAVEAGTSKDTDRMVRLTAELFALFTQTKALAEAFGLTIHGLPVLPSPASTSLPFVLTALPLALGVMPRRRGDPVREIAGGADGIDPGMILSISTGMIDAAGPLVAGWVTKNPGDQAKAENAAKLLAGFLGELGKVLPGIIDGSRNPASINLSELWPEDYEHMLARLRAEQG